MSEFKYTLKPPKMRLLDWIFAIFGVAYTLVVAAIVFALLVTCVSGCNDPEGDFDPELGLGDPAELTPLERVVSNLELTGYLAYITEGGLAADSSQCSFIGDVMTANLTRLTRNHPLMVGKFDIVPCDQLRTFTNLWWLSCETLVYTASKTGEGAVMQLGPEVLRAAEAAGISFMAYYEYYVERTGWEEKEEVGWSYLTFDLQPIFWCTFVFRFTTVEAEYANH